VLSGRGLSITLGATLVLDAVSVDLQAGELVTVVGPNGAGKSTLLRALCGEQRLANGRIVMDNKPLASWPRRERARRLAVMPQHSTLSFPFSGHDVVLMGRTPHLRGAESPRDYEIAYDALAVVGAQALAERIYSTLSGGERQRVQLARALAQLWEPPSIGARYLLLDEPTASLDLAHQHHALETVRRVARDGVGVLAVLHDLNLAAQYGDRILVLKDGRQQRMGAPWEVLTPALIEDVFEIAVLVIPHPRETGPCIIPIPGTPPNLRTQRRRYPKTCSNP
jgi:iron complex transport system ATP-binding protein